MIFVLGSTILILVIYSAFFLVSKKAGWSQDSGGSFECGFSPYFFSHQSFSMHYFLVGLIFLFLDLELCLLMPFFNSEFSALKSSAMLAIFVLILIMGVLLEWSTGKLNWKF